MCPGVFPRGGGQALGQSRQRLTASVPAGAFRIAVSAPRATMRFAAPPYAPAARASRRARGGRSRTAESSPHLKIFLRKRLPQKGYPLSAGRNRFWTGFWERGMSNFQNPKVPPTGGRICRTHLAFHKGGGGSARPARSRAALHAQRQELGRLPQKQTIHQDWENE